MKKVIKIIFKLAIVTMIFASLWSNVYASQSYIVPFTVTPEDPDPAVDTEDTQTGVEPLIFKLGTEDFMEEQGMTLYEHGDGVTEGTFSPDVLDGVSCLKLEYSYPTESKLPEYRFMPKFSGSMLLTEEHKYMIISYRTNSSYPAELTLLNNANRANPLILDTECAKSDGEWIRSEAVDISDGYLERFLIGDHCTLGFNCAYEDAVFHVSEIGFFGSASEAYAYYGEDSAPNRIEHYAMEFTKGAAGAVYSGDNYGNNYVDDFTGELVISYAENTDMEVSYMAKIKFNTSSKYTSDMRYMRVLYSAKNPEGVTGAGMYIRNDSSYHTYCLVPDIADTNGRYVLSDTVYVSQSTADRFAGTGAYSVKLHNSLLVNTTKEGGQYGIKAVYFFRNRADAEAFTVDDNIVNITVNGNDIGKYSIVIPENAAPRVSLAAEMLRGRIYDITGSVLPIITDDLPKSEYEILVGASLREKSSIDCYVENVEFNNFAIIVDKNSIVLTSALGTAIENAVDDFVSAYFGAKGKVHSEDIVITDNVMIGRSTYPIKTEMFELYDNVKSPVKISTSFGSDEGYFTEESGADRWKYQNGEYTVDAGEFTYSYVHVYEPDATVSAKMKIVDKGDDGEAGLLLRCTADRAWLKAGYDFKRGEWFIDSREGADFYRVRLTSKASALDAGTWYELSFTADGEDVCLHVNGEKILAATGASQLTPGRLGFFAEDVRVSFDDAEAVLLSGEGTVFTYTEHTALSDEIFSCDGAVIEMSDGTLCYIKDGKFNYVSNDGGITWTETESAFATYGQPNVIRLSDSTLLLIGNDGTNVISLTSTDDGKTWTNGGIVCPMTVDGATASNQNDKLFVSPKNGRIFFTQSFSGQFCMVFYSDDNGISWKSSENDTRSIEGNEKAEYFAECKVLECADGTLRLYNSWNKYGCVVYSESKDNGVTWGPLCMIPELECSHSSMQFVRDIYADNEYTYYMVWIYSVDDPESAMPRSRLSLAKSEDGKEWKFVGDVWRWESGYYANSNKNAMINQIVNPFINTTEDSVIVGTGASERMASDSRSDHQQQRQHIWTFKKTALPEGKALNVFDDIEPSGDIQPGESVSLDKNATWLNHAKDWDEATNGQEITAVYDGMLLRFPGNTTRSGCGVTLTLDGLTANTAYTVTCDIVMESGDHGGVHISTDCGTGAVWVGSSKTATVMSNVNIGDKESVLVTIKNQSGSVTPNFDITQITVYEGTSQIPYKVYDFAENIPTIGRIHGTWCDTPNAEVIGIFVHTSVSETVAGTNNWAPNQRAVYCQLSEPLTLEAGTYKLSCDIRPITGNDSGKRTFGIQLLSDIKANGTASYFATVIGYVVGSDENPYAPVNVGEWNTIERTFTFEESVTLAYVSIRGGTSAEFDGGAYDVRDITLENVTVEVPEVVCGDANGDGEVTNEDLVLLCQYIARWNGYETINVSMMDINSDGKVNPLDVVYLARHIANWDSYKTLPVLSEA